MRYVVFDETRPMDLILLGRVAIVFCLFLSFHLFAQFCFTVFVHFK